LLFLWAIMLMAVAYGMCYRTVPQGIWHIECPRCGFRFVQGDEDAKWIHGTPHFECLSCGETLEAFERLS
jgi:hypothetical protein